MRNDKLQTLSACNGADVDVINFALSHQRHIVNQSRQNTKCYRDVTNPNRLTRHLSYWATTKQNNQFFCACLYLVTTLLPPPIFLRLKHCSRPPTAANHPGLLHAECMTTMTLGSGIFSPSRMLLRQLVVFAQWESEEALNRFLANTNLGMVLTKGWHTRLLFLRQ